MSQRLKFGVFLAPFHKPGINPTQALSLDLKFMEQLDELGFDEAWIGEHHSAGTELIASPEIFIAAAAERTRSLRFGTGVTSIAYHNPLWVADRMVQLDHMTRGRVMLGVGPGSLPTDSAMIGLNPTDTRELLSENLDIIVRLLRGETEGFDALAHHWQVAQERAEHYGTTVDRRKWRLVSLFHLAETEAKAREEVRYGIEFWFNYFQEIAAFPQMGVTGDTIDQLIDFITEARIGVVGTAEQARAHVQRLVDQSGGFGSLLQLGHNWANRQDTYKSYEIFSREVIPHFQGHAEKTLEASAQTRKVHAAYAADQMKAVDHMTRKYQAELAAKKA